MVKIHKSTDTVWHNAAGDAVPFKFVPQVDKQKESLAGKIHTAALKVEASLTALHELVTEATTAVQSWMKTEYAIKHKKAKKEAKAFTWFNFDRSIKIEADVNDIIKWNDALLTEAHTLLNEYISGEIGDTHQLIKGLVNDAFSSSRGAIDSRKVFQILKHESKIKNSKFQKACTLIKQAQDVDKTKLYQRVWEVQSNGEYRNINLNFSSL